MLTMSKMLKPTVSQGGTKNIKESGPNGKQGDINQTWIMLLMVALRLCYSFSIVNKQRSGKRVFFNQVTQI